MTSLTEAISIMRNFFNPTGSFRNRIMFVSTIVLVASVVTLATFNWFSFRHESRARLNATADIIASDVAAALAFGAFESITKSLAVFDADPSIRQIFILDEAGRISAYYHRNENLQIDPQMARLRLDSLRSNERKVLQISISAERSIIRDGIPLGTVLLEQDEGIIVNKAIVTAGYAFVFFMFFLLVSFLLADRFQRETSEQITSLTETMLEISRTKDFSIRVTERYNRDINRLSDCFNEMLSEVADRDRELLERQKELSWMANYDSLTGLPNRTLFMDRLDQAILRQNRIGGKLAVLFIDIDDFKLVNDTHGHRVGDLLLQSAAKRLDGLRRAEDTFARLGGDEFTLLLTNVHSVEDALYVGRKHLESLLKPFEIEDNSMFISASMGTALFPEHGTTTETLLKSADSAMYLAKAMGKNHIEVFNNSLHMIASERLSLNNDLRKALEHGEFELYFQPRVNICTNSWGGAEALLRWNHPTLGMIPPSKFIPLAEETGVILPIGEWVIAEACRHLGVWQAKGVNILKLSVNVSPLQLHRQDLAALIRAALDENGLSPECFEAEITESAVMRDMEHSIAVLHELQNFGIKISLDDFGTGYSSLSNLRSLPINILKIDRSFVNRIHKSGEDAKIFSAIASIASAIGIGLVAEGVECVEQEQVLAGLGCCEMQGYYYAPPMKAEELERLAMQLDSWPNDFIRRRAS